MTPDTPKDPEQSVAGGSTGKGKTTSTSAALLFLSVFMLVIGGCEHLVGWSLPSKRHPFGRAVAPVEVWFGIVVGTCLFVAAVIAKIYEICTKIE